MSQYNSQSPLIDLHTRMHNCRLCLEAGYGIVPRAIFSGGPVAQVMIIGQAPGITEVEAGRPFNAGSGSRLFQWLSKAGVGEDWFRRTQYMTAVTKCYPGKARNGGGDRVPSRAERELCRPYLLEEISLIDPRLIIPVGRLAIDLFYPPGQPLAQVIGAQQQVDGRWIVPLPHPSGASRWHQIRANQILIDRAIELIGFHVKASMTVDCRQLTADHRPPTAE